MCIESVADLAKDDLFYLLEKIRLNITCKSSARK